MSCLLNFIDSILFRTLPKIEIRPSKYSPNFIQLFFVVKFEGFFVQKYNLSQLLFHTSILPFRCLVQRMFHCHSSILNYTELQYILDPLLELRTHMLVHTLLDQYKLKIAHYKHEQVRQLYPVDTNKALYHNLALFHIHLRGKVHLN